VSRSRYALAAILYALVMAYASTFVGRLGLHFVPLDPAEALNRLVNIPYVEHGSNQRSDWMGNLLLLVPLGFLTAGWFTPRERGSPLAAIAAFAGCFLFILLVKYAQIFFPPRTVTLNYVIAQSLGAAAGVLLFAIMRKPLAQIGDGMTRLESLRLALRIYTGLSILFLLMPLDFALSLEDIATQLEKLPETFTAISGEGRPFVVRVAVILGGVLGMMPVGAMLTIVGSGRVYVGRNIGGATWIGFCAMTGVFALTCLVISGAASLPAIGFRTIGIALGAWMMHALTRRDPDRIRHDLGYLVPWGWPVYLIALAAVNGLLSLNWYTPGEAADAFNVYNLIPLFNYYIVTKPQAAKNIIAHAIMYAPVGVMFWLRARHDGGKTAAFALAALLSAIVEFGRFLRPGLVADINAIPLAGAAAWGAMTLMRLLWQLLAAIATGGTSASPLPLSENARVLNWREREANRHSRRRDSGDVIGDIEDY
jgi:VanZ family protein